ncbi:RluA family pseudouridine synthase [Planktothrix paucivesiculata]|uniref:Pseudouridine synthase n=1 Tax=Planktothrix paucivesiculata PCC 9631 TaxID=671071 RepID=A0A7Z9BLQ1_9CYAN|nr:RluA family pseudouridine synthase [Planktothrix paucivesiculata]VXD17309.1 putative enzyme [Planktothrix paucivesiculata PCC 9631]
MNDSALIELTVDTENLPQDKQHRRLDVWLSQQIPDLSRSRIQNLISAGWVKINQQVCTTKKVSVQGGDRLEIILPPPEPLDLEAVDIPLDILYEDDCLLILNKPAGLVVHPSPGHQNDTLVNRLLAHCDHLSGIGGVQRPGIVHRLDKDTTGAIVVAKTDFALQSLQAQIKSKTARRQYLGVVYGVPKTESGTINQPIGRHPIDRKKMAIVPIENSGREAITHWQMQERIGNYTLMLFTLETGRTHQIRVHTAFMGNPIVGDPEYSRGKAIGVNLPGQALHAWKLTLNHPISGEIIEAIAPIPDTLKTLLEVLRRR